MSEELKFKQSFPDKKIVKIERSAFKFFIILDK